MRGYIPVPVLVAIIIGVSILGGGYLIAHQLSKSPQPASEQIGTNATTTATTTESSEVEQLRKEVDALKSQQAKTVKTIYVKTPTASDSQEITSADLQPYLDAIGVVTCWDVDYNPQFGTAVLFKPGKLMTNWHVISGMDTCLFVNEAFKNPKYQGTAEYRMGEYILDIPSASRTDNTVDFAIVPFRKNENAISHGAPIDEYLDVSQLNYKVGSLTKCSPKVAVGLPVAILGYPASSINLHFSQPPLSVTTGIVSGYTADDNYLVSAKVDHGNSGGLALSKENGGVCLLGIPTWVVAGQAESAGIVQNIRNLLGGFLDTLR